MKEPTYFRGLSRIEYGHFLAAKLGHKLQFATANKLVGLGLCEWRDERPGYRVVPSVRYEHKTWRRKNYTPDGKRIRPAGIPGGRKEVA